MANELLFHPVAAPFPEAELPQVTVEAYPEFEELYRVAWRLAWDHVSESPVMPYSPYMSEGCKVNRFWIWDSCFMAMFCRYAAQVYPGLNTLDNLYAIHENANISTMVIHHLDNPPLFAWAEWQYYALSGDVERLKTVLPKLIRHYNWLETVSPTWPRSQSSPIFWKKEKGGYCWSGCPSGMDNTPRGRGDYSCIHWIDALGQITLTAQYISKIAAEIGDDATSARFAADYAEKKALVATFWDKKTNCFLDRYRDKDDFCRVITPASFWPLMAQCATLEQAQLQSKLLTDPTKLGGEFPFASVTHDDPAFHPEGAYWSGGIWLPVAYMSVKALEQYGMYDLASQMSLTLLKAMARTYQEYTPHSIWECYSPTEAKPSTNKVVGEICRVDFCGWSALGPISMLIENLIGVQEVSAKTQTITWRPGIAQGKLGIRNLHVGGNVISLMRQDNAICAEATQDFTLNYGGKVFKCAAGKNNFPLA